MIKVKILSPMGIFIGYILAALVLILGFRFVFSGQAAPLRNFSVPWRLILGLLDFINLFPALALSSLVIPFGLRGKSPEAYVTRNTSPFSPRFFEQVKAPVISAIAAAAVYGLLFLLVLPLARDADGSMRFQGGLFRLAKERAGEYAEAGDWPQAAQFLALCDRVWPNSPEIASLRTDISIGLNEYRLSLPDPLTDSFSAPGNDPALIPLPGGQAPLNTAEALALADRALREERFYDAHWLANLGRRLAGPGSADAAEAVRLAGIAWNAVSSLEPNARELETYALYHLKRDGYEAMVSGDWIRAYYIFKELIEKTPGDPDTVNFMAMSEQGVAGVAFFTDEIKLALGDVLTGAVLSLPGASGGRVVLRLSSLSTFPDFSFGQELELAAFDAAGRPDYQVTAPYVKILPFTLGTEPRLLLLMRALDREDERIRREPVWTGNEGPETGNVQMILDMSYEELLLAGRVLQGMDNLSMGDLFTAAVVLGDYGYVPQVFQAEILRRVAEPALFLPIAILGIVIGWRYRAKKRPRYIGFPMLGVIPLVFHGGVYFYRSLIGALNIFAVLSAGFSMALPLLIAGMILLFLLSLIILAAQHG
jgi:predicted secreted protein